MDFEITETDKISPSKKSDIVRIDVFSLNGKDFDHKFLGKDVKDLWRSLKHDPNDVIGQSSSKINKNTLRVNIQLRLPIPLKEVLPSQDFQFEKATDFKNYTYDCRVVGLGQVREARAGDIVTVSIKRGHFRFKPEEATVWIEKFGKVLSPLRLESLSLHIQKLLVWGRTSFPILLVLACVNHQTVCWTVVLHTRRPTRSVKVLVADQSRFYSVKGCWLFTVFVRRFSVISSRYCWSSLLPPSTPIAVSLVLILFLTEIISIFFINSYDLDPEGLRTETIVGEVELIEHIPEWLPMYGCRVRIYYHGQKTKCNKCWEVGHQARACPADKKATWKDFVQRLAESGRFKRETFGSWLEEKPPAKPDQTREEQMKVIMDSGLDLRKLVDLLKEKEKPSGSRAQTVAKDGKEKKKGRPKGSTSANAANKRRKVQDE